MKNLGVNKKDYKKMCRDEMPRTNFLKTLPPAFLTGGSICALGQILIFFYVSCGFSKGDSSALASCTLVFLSAVLTGLNVFDDIASFAGAGTLLPITGFANSVASPALEFKSEGFITGVGVKMFVIAGPVLVYGNLAACIYGVVYYLFQRF